ncbi:hypothetical protein GEV33_011368 [Tenebrio molitor]|uniref:Uncharacterized protein n=1 Tax=Tenebrio molitor TaxID=7067 RepID=A0A8J6HAX8_TENMO|nr:hypothetical protein GEV33_011368 [Tenebrio molitor]
MNTLSDITNIENDSEYFDDHFKLAPFAFPIPLVSPDFPENREINQFENIAGYRYFPSTESFGNPLRVTCLGRPWQQKSHNEPSRSGDLDVAVQKVKNQNEQHRWRLRQRNNTLFERMVRFSILWSIVDGGVLGRFLQPPHKTHGDPAGGREREEFSRGRRCTTSSPATSAEVQPPVEVAHVTFAEAFLWVNRITESAGRGLTTSTNIKLNKDVVTHVKRYKSDEHKGGENPTGEATFIIQNVKQAGASINAIARPLSQVEKGMPKWRDILTISGKSSPPIRMIFVPFEVEFVDSTHHVLNIWFFGDVVTVPSRFVPVGKWRIWRVGRSSGSAGTKPSQKHRIASIFLAIVLY